MSQLLGSKNAVYKARGARAGENAIDARNLTYIGPDVEWKRKGSQQLHSLLFTAVYVEWCAELNDKHRICLQIDRPEPDAFGFGVVDTGGGNLSIGTERAPTPGVTGPELLRRHG
jgi:hypothetical protein